MSRRALVTGASPGIGRAIALRLGADEVEATCTGRDGPRLEETAAPIGAGGGAATILELDLRDAAAVGELSRNCGPIDALVANSGVSGPSGPIWEIDLAEWEATLQVNVTGGFLLARAMLPNMLERGSAAPCS
jgi:NAD(P)-dependent dehydrogenase (short-subunit alcohol dehydrogenase family)